MNCFEQTLKGQRSTPDYKSILRSVSNDSIFCSLQSSHGSVYDFFLSQETPTCLWLIGLEVIGHTITTMLASMTPGPLLVLWPWGSIHLNEASGLLSTAALLGLNWPSLCGDMMSGDLSCIWAQPSHSDSYLNKSKGPNCYNPFKLGNRLTSDLFYAKFLHIQFTQS